MTRATSGKRTGSEQPTESSDQRRHDLLEASYALIAEKGLEGLRTRDIAARAGVNISTLHYYFGTKEELLVAVVEYVREKFTARPAPRHGEAAMWDESPTLRSHLEASWRSFQDDEQLTLVLQELLTRSHRDPAGRAAFRSMHLFWNKVVEDLLRAEVERGSLRADLDPQAGARIVTSFIMGAVMQLGVNAKAFDFGAVARELERWASPPPAEK